MGIKYFAYGSNMSCKVIFQVCPKFKIIGSAKLNNYRLVFTRKSQKYKAGVADIIPAKNFIVWGVLYDIAENEVANLDRKEDLGRAYKKTNVKVVDKYGNIFQAMTYTVISKSTKEIKPSSEYLNMIIEGAKDHKHKDSYIKFLESLKTDRDRWIEKGFLVSPTERRREAKGKNILKVSALVKRKLNLKSLAVVVYGNKACLVKVAVEDIDEKACQVDQTVRNVLGFPSRDCYGTRVSIFQVKRSEFGFPFVRPRTITLPLERPSLFHSEKKICVIHSDNISLLGLKEGEYVRILSVIADKEGKFRIHGYTLRAFSSSGRKLKRDFDTARYPKISKIYIDLDGRAKLGLPRNEINTPIVISVDVWKLFASRLLYYGITLFLGLVAITPIVYEISGLSKKIAFSIALLFSIIITVILCIFDVRGKVQY